MRNYDCKKKEGTNKYKQQIKCYRECIVLENCVSSVGKQYVYTYIYMIILMMFICCLKYSYVGNIKKVVK